MSDVESNFNAALGAFTESIADEASQENQPEPSAPVEPTAPSDQGTEAPASKDLDLSHLPEEAQIYLRAREREMTADYTRKTQEAAQQRQEAEQALQFIQALNSDPQFARQVAGFIQQGLPQEYQDDGPDFEPDEYGEAEDPYESEIRELKEWRESLEDQMYEAQLSAHLDRQVADIRSENPAFSERDVQAIIELGYATDGDLYAAVDIYQGISDNVLGRYLESKRAVTAPAPLPNTSGSTAPVPIQGVENLRAAALERIRNELG